MRAWAISSSHRTAHILPDRTGEFEAVAVGLGAYGQGMILEALAVMDEKE